MSVRRSEGEDLLSRQSLETLLFSKGIGLGEGLDNH